MTMVRMARGLLGSVLAVSALALASCSDAGAGEDIGERSQAATVPSGFFDETVATGISNPTAMAFAPDGRLFVSQQQGQLRVIKSGSLLSTPFLTVTVNSSGERGLLGIAFDPGFANNHFVYVYYTATTVSTLSLRTNPPGLQVTLDGTPVQTPADIGSVVGMTRQLGTVAAELRWQQLHLQLLV